MGQVTLLASLPPDQTQMFRWMKILGIEVSSAGVRLQAVNTHEYLPRTQLSLFALLPNIPETQCSLYVEHHHQS